MSASPLKDLQKGLAVGWVNANDLHLRRQTSCGMTGGWCSSASGVTRNSSSSPKTQRPRTSHSRNSKSMMSPREKRIPTAITPPKPILIVDPLLFPEEESQDLCNCRQQAAQVLTVNAHAKQAENRNPVRPPLAPAPERLPTPDLPELECGSFCDCCWCSATQATKEVMVSREKTGRKRETMYFGMETASNPYHGKIAWY
jgi:hypothetical protein